MSEHRVASFEDLENVPSNCVGEIVDGNLYVIWEEMRSCQTSRRGGANVFQNYRTPPR